MTTITLESIKAEHAKLADMIAAFEKQQEPSALFFPEATINLAHGEHYAGIVIGKDSEPSYHLVLMAATTTNDLSWQAANDWAKRIGGDLPTRREQSLLFANLKDAFEERAYWSCEDHDSESGWAWCQYFSLGSQLSTLKSNELRARAVRRLVIE